jgi:hypothetical protein
MVCMRYADASAHILSASYYNYLQVNSYESYQTIYLVLTEIIERRIYIRHPCNDFGDCDLNPLIKQVRQRR